jgi:hypothetical protein
MFLPLHRSVPPAWLPISAGINLTVTIDSVHNQQPTLFLLAGRSVVFSWWFGQGSDYRETQT